MLQKVAKMISEEQMKLYLRNRLGNLMEEKQLNQIKLSQKTGISRQNIAKYLSGIALPNSYTLYKLAYALDVSCDYLLGKDEGTDHEINYFIEKTGLSEKALNKLFEYTQQDNNNKENLLFAISMLLENEAAKDFFLSFTRYTAIPDIDNQDFSDLCFVDLYGKYTSVLGDSRIYDYGDTFDSIKIEEIIYHQLMKSFQELLSITKNNPDTKKEYIRMFEDRVQTEYDIKLHKQVNDIIDMMTE